MTEAAKWFSWFSHRISSRKRLRALFGKEMSRPKWTCIMLDQLGKLARRKHFSVDWEHDEIDMVWAKKARIEVAIEHEFKGDRIDKVMKGEVRNLLSLHVPLRVLIVYFRPTHFARNIVLLKRRICASWTESKGELLLIASKQKKHHAPDGNWIAYRLAPGSRIWERL